MNDLDKDQQLTVERPWLDQGHSCADDPALAQPPHALVAGWRRKAALAGQILTCDPAIILKNREDGAIDRIYGKVVFHHEELRVPKYSVKDRAS